MERVSYMSLVTIYENLLDSPKSYVEKKNYSILLLVRYSTCTCTLQVVLEL